MINKKNKKAAAIKYTKENLDTPVISAFGNDKFAEEIINQAKKNKIDIVENKEFFEFENLFSIGSEIPIEVYKIVANIIAQIINTNKVSNNG
jgi:flagellar biosynthesis protein